MGGVEAATDARAVLARHGKSFHWASRLLAGPEAERCARLYAFCRRVDDWADETDPAEAGPALEGVRRDLAAGSSDHPVVADFLELAEETGLDRKVASCFVEGVARDLGPVAVRNEAELLRYAHGVAGTVGVMMCAALGVEDRRALPFAVDLGVAMQLTNICRDVAEDARAGRVYLPRTRLRASTRVEDLATGEPRAVEDARAVVRHLLRQADRYYRSADRGLCHLPRRARLAILTASRIYRAIGPRVLAQPPGAWGRRAVVGRWAKLALTLRALGAFLLRPRYWSSRRAREHRHDAGLHAPLRSLPGADPAA